MQPPAESCTINAYLPLFSLPLMITLQIKSNILMNTSELMIDMIMIVTTKEKMVDVTRICPMMTVTRDDFPLYLTLTVRHVHCLHWCHFPGFPSKSLKIRFSCRTDDLFHVPQHQPHTQCLWWTSRTITQSQLEMLTMDKVFTLSNLFLLRLTKCLGFP